MIRALVAALLASLLLAGSATGQGVAIPVSPRAVPQLALTAGAGTTVFNGALTTSVYVATIPYTLFVTNGTDSDITIATLPAKTYVVHALADLTTTFACTATCTSATLSAYVGKSAGGNEYLLSFDADNAAAQFGDAAGELGASLAPATIASGIGDLGSWSTTTTVSIRLHSGTGNIGNGTATNLSKGSITIYLVVARMPS